MFSGIVKSIGVVKEIYKNENGKNIKISAPNLDLTGVKIGDSIAVSGCCLTVTAINGKELSFYISADTLKKTTLTMLSNNSFVNLETSLRMGDYIGGHMISGHIDETARVVEVSLLGVDKRIKLEISNFGKNVVVQRGSVAVDGVSLTVAYIAGNILTLNIIPHTLENTTIKYLNTNTNYLVNIEYNEISKHVYKLVKQIIVR